MKRTLREWRQLWQKWDINDYAEIEQLFTDADIEEEEWDNVCEVDILLTTKGGNIELAEIQIFDEEGEIIVQYEYNVPFQLGRPELINLIESINDDSEDDEDEDEVEDEDDEEEELEDDPAL